MMKRINIGIPLVTGILTVLLIGCSYFGNSIIHEKPLPVQQKLADITGDKTEAVVRLPNAEPWSFQLVVGLPSNNSTNLLNPRPCPKFQGQITVTNMSGDLVGQFHVNSSNAQQCNWLIHQHNLDGFILNWSEADNMLKSCKMGETYTIRLDFTERPKEFLSFWLSYIQSQNQK